MAKKKKCYLYLRVSTEIQVEGYSLDAQRERLLSEAAHRDMQVVEEFRDEGKSGKNTTGRPAFTKMMRRIQNGNPDGVDYVLVFKLSRFGRNAADVLSNLQLMQDYGVNLISADDGIDSSIAAGKLVTAMLAAVAEIERENIWAQTTAGRRQKASEGKWNGGPVPLGYRLVKDGSGRNGHLATHEDEARLVRLIFEKYAHTGMGYSGVAKWLNRNGYRRPVPANGKYDVFTELTVKTILDNPVYTGKIVHGRYGLEKVKGERNEYRHVKRDQYEMYEGMHEAIIPDDLWEAAQAKRKAAAGKPQEHFGPKHIHVLSAIVRCPVCGKPMYGNTSGRTKDSRGRVRPPVFYYTCKHASRSTGSSCTYNRSVREETLDRQVIKVVQQAVNSLYIKKRLIIAMGSSDDLDELSANLDALRAERSAAEKKKSRLLDRIENLDADSDQYDVMFRDLQGVLQRHNQSIAELSDQIEELSIRVRNARDGAASFDEMLRAYYNAMGSIESWPAEQLRAFMRSFLVSLDGGLTFSDVIDMAPDDGDQPDDGPDGGSGGPDGTPDRTSPGDDAYMREELLPNPDVVTHFSGTGHQLVIQQALGVAGYTGSQQHIHYLHVCGEHGGLQAFQCHGLPGAGRAANGNQASQTVFVLDSPNGLQKSGFIAEASLCEFQVCSTGHQVISRHRKNHSVLVQHHVHDFLFIIFLIQYTAAITAFRHGFGAGGAPRAIQDVVVP